MRKEIVFVWLLLFWLVGLKPIFAHAETITIKMTADGFLPQNVEFHQGSKVIFLNADNVFHWPASDNHPTHELYPEFDPRRPVAASDLWGFTFDRVGKWRFHDHLHPHLRGTITVIAQEVVSQDINKLNIFQRLESFVSGLFSKILSKFSPKTKFPDKNAKKEWADLVATYGDQPGSFGEVHDKAHLVGGRLFDQLGWDGLAVCTTKFAFGCYHGFLDKAFAGSLANLPKALNACDLLGALGSGPNASCIHGIGHGVASFYQTSDLSGAIAVCQGIGPQRSVFCTDGVFMEFGRNAAPSFYTPERAISLCQETSPEFAHSCGRNIPDILRSRFNKSFKEVIATCQQLGGEISQGCFDALSFAIASGAKGDSQTVFQGCQDFKQEEQIANCVTKAAGEMVFQELPGWQSSAFAACDFLEGVSKQSCQRYVQRIKDEYHRQ